MIPPYEVRCTQPGCSRLAVYKIAARWSDGSTEELKTYALCCAECLPVAYRDSRAKQQACRTARGESLEAPGIYLMVRGRRDRSLERRPHLEAQLNGTT